MGRRGRADNGSGRSAGPAGTGAAQCWSLPAGKCGRKPSASGSAERGAWALPGAALRALRPRAQARGRGGPGLASWAPGGRGAGVLGRPGARLPAPSARFPNICRDPHPAGGIGGEAFPSLSAQKLPSCTPRYLLSYRCKLRAPHFAGRAPHPALRRDSRGLGAL